MDHPTAAQKRQKERAFEQWLVRYREAMIPALRDQAAEFKRMGIT